jgi:hypothetical protein
MDIIDEQWELVRPSIPEPETLQPGPKGGGPGSAWSSRAAFPGVYPERRSGIPDTQGVRALGLDLLYQNTAKTGPFWGGFERTQENWESCGLTRGSRLLPGEERDFA